MHVIFQLLSNTFNKKSR